MGACVGCGAGGDSGSFVKQGGDVPGMLGSAGEGLGGNGKEREGVAPGILNYHQTKFCVCVCARVRACTPVCREGAVSFPPLQPYFSLLPALHVTLQQHQAA